MNDLRKGVVSLILEKLTAGYVVERNAFFGNRRFITFFKLLLTVVIQGDPFHILTALGLLFSTASFVSKCL